MNVLNKQLIKLSICALFIFGFSSPALADIIRWHFSDTTFHDGTSVTGYFDYDTSSGDIISRNITTQNGNLTAYTYNNLNNNSSRQEVDTNNAFGFESILHFETPRVDPDGTGTTPQDRWLWVINPDSTNITLDLSQAVTYTLQPLNGNFGYENIRYWNLTPSGELIDYSDTTRYLNAVTLIPEIISTNTQGIIRWGFSGTTFYDGTSVTGYFDYDTSSGDIINRNITTQDGDLSTYNYNNLNNTVSWQEVDTNNLYIFESLIHFQTPRVDPDGTGTTPQDRLLWIINPDSTNIKLDLSQAVTYTLEPLNVAIGYENIRYWNLTSSGELIDYYDTTRYLNAVTLNPEIITIDDDDDRISNRVDTEPSTPSSAFSDIPDGTTGGEIIDNGDQELMVMDIPDPEGVMMIARSTGGTNPATVSVCGGSANITLTPGDIVIVTCGSVTLTAVKGTAGATFIGNDGTNANANINERNEVTFDPETVSFKTAAGNFAPIVVTVNGHKITLKPGETGKAIMIDIQPGSAVNSINLSSSGVIPLGILSSANFDATTVLPETVNLNGAGVKLVGKSNKSLCHEEDVNHDGLTDLLCKILTEELLIEPGTSIAVMKAQTINGLTIHGEDHVNIVPD